MTNSAIFIDLENFYIAARKKVSHEFAFTLLRDAGKWTKALRRYDERGGGTRRVQRDWVIQKCYSSEPFWIELQEDQRRSKQFKDFNFYNVLRDVGYDMIHCPILSKEGKNASDIKLAVDAMKFANTYHDLREIYIFAGDCDYLPLIEEIRRISIDVYFVNFPGSVTAPFLEKAEWLGARFLSHVDFYLLLDSIAMPYRQLTTQDEEALALLKPLIQSMANERQGFVPIHMVADIIKDHPEIASLIDWNRHLSLNGFLENVTQLADWMKVDADYQGLRVPNTEIDIQSWGVDDPKFRQFVIDSLVAIDDPIPFNAPADFMVLFKEIPVGFARGNSLNGVADRARQRLQTLNDSTISPIDALRLVTAVTERFASPANVKPTDCADSWRLEIFKLARKPAFMRSEQGRRHLCSWFAVDGEIREDAVARLDRLMHALDAK